jgi:hypothetical protein
MSDLEFFAILLIGPTLMMVGALAVLFFTRLRKQA